MFNYDIIIPMESACHFRPNQKDTSACGIRHPYISAWDGRDVDCKRCKNTKAWKKYMGKENK